MAEARIEEGVRLASRGRRWAYLAAGHTSLGLGILGAFLPLLPTTIFLIMAASCYAKASPTLHRKLLDNPTFGPLIRDWQEHRAMSKRAKVLAVSMIVVTFVGTVAVIPVPWVKILHIGIGAALVTYILRIQTR
ncbi:MAG: YbaN family protein [Gemmatimonadales bacterium]